MKKSNLLITVGFASLLIFGLAHFKKGSVPRQVAQASSKKEVGLNQEFRNKLIQEETKILTSDQSEKIEKENPRLSRVEKQLLSNVIKYDLLKRSLNRKALREQLIRELKGRPEVFQIAVQALHDLDSTLQRFPESQAQVRIFAVDLVRDRAKAGDTGPLTASLERVSKELEEKSNWKRGRDQDLIDLIGAWIEVKGTQYVLQHPKEMVSTIHYHPELKKAVIQAFNLYLKDGVNDEEVDRIFHSHLNQI